MTRLPSPGSDDGTWGAILNDFLSVSHNTDGTLKAVSQSSITSLVADLAAKAPLASPAFTGAPTVNGSALSTAGDALPVFSVDNYASPAAAYAALVSAGGGRLLFTAGHVYNVSTGLVFDQAVPTYVIMHGATLIPATGITLFKFNVPLTMTQISITGGRISGATTGGSGGTHIGVVIQDHYNAVLHDVKIENCGTGVLITDSTRWSESSEFENVYVANCGIGIDI